MKCETCKHYNISTVTYNKYCRPCKWQNFKRKDNYEPIEPKEVGNADNPKQFVDKYRRHHERDKV